MDNKKIILGICAIVIITAIFIISEKMTTVKPPEHRAKLFPNIEERHITAIAIKEGNNAVRIEKKDGVWMAGKGDELVPADSASAQIVVEKIISLKKSGLISENPEKQSTFEVDSANGMSVEIFVSGKEAPAGILRIGKSGPEWNSNYVRMVGSDAVYLISGGLKYSLFTDFEKWKKKEPPPATEPEIVGDGATGKD